MHGHPNEMVLDELSQGSRFRSREWSETSPMFHVWVAICLYPINREISVEVNRLVADSRITVPTPHARIRSIGKTKSGVSFVRVVDNSTNRVCIRDQPDVDMTQCFGSLAVRDLLLLNQELSEFNQ